MKMYTLMSATAAMLISSSAIAQADDHLFQAQQSGLQPGSTASSTTHAFTPNSAGHSGASAPGQGSPFTGEETKIPATETGPANLHANVKSRI
ncbi:hypothetical protein CN184_32425 [Sinorhizobium medicae]|uniref:hypothetical protein n=1 Tax=Sinorhizobium medicae TaxID=110321 RepID=UPI000FD2D97E|nr:hypothetical protein [Sinorhizobium medicae]RVJ15145.1 hypothetical protein CN184_32425 [Sinorhizobium medicae]